MRTVIITITILFNVLLLQAQEFKSATENKALVYFARLPAMGFAINFRYFDGKEYIGKFKGSGYVTYECEPGNHLFWASSENADYIQAELEAGKTYVIIAGPKVGAFKARIALKNLDFSDKKTVNKVLKLLEKNAPTYISSSEIKKGQIKYADHISESIAEYQSLFADSNDIQTIVSGMEVPIEYLSKGNKVTTSKYLKE